MIENRAYFYFYHETFDKYRTSPYIQYITVLNSVLLFNSKQLFALKLKRINRRLHVVIYSGTVEETRIREPPIILQGQNTLEQLLKYVEAAEIYMNRRKQRGQTQFRLYLFMI